MNLTALALTGYIAWFLILITSIVLIHTVLTLSGKRQANSFSPEGNDVSDFKLRLHRAHANTLEAMPYIGGLLLLALATNTSQITDQLAMPLLYARILQSTVHLISTNNLAVMARFTFLSIQLAICFYWVIKYIQVFM
jgi:uncharacterized MAPEG superfamily protein